jgi:ABC-type branched-subunit amino acid transport system ATPase component
MGKSTLMRADGLSAGPTAGRIAFEGRDITRAPTHERVRLGMGFVPQGREIFPALSVTDNLLMGCAKDRGDASRTVEAVLADFPRRSRCSAASAACCRAASSSWLALARCRAAGRASCSWTNPPRASSRRSSRRWSRPCMRCVRAAA